MYQSVSNNRPFDVAELKEMYLHTLCSIGDDVLNVQRFGIKKNINRLLFIKTKNLLNVVDRPLDGDTLKISLFHALSYKNEFSDNIL